PLVGGVPGKAGGGGPRGSRGSTRQSRGRGAPRKSGEYPAQPGKGGPAEVGGVPGAAGGGGRSNARYCRLGSASEAGRRLLEQLCELALRRPFPRRDVLAWQPALRLLVVAQDVSGHRLPVHLVRAVVEPRRPSVPVHRLQGQVAGIAPRAVYLDG